MARCPFILITIFLVLIVVHAEEVQHPTSVKKPSDYLVNKDGISHDKMHTEAMNSSPQHSEAEHADPPLASVQNAGKQESDVHPSDVLPSEPQQPESHHSEEQRPAAQQSSEQNSKKNVVTARQFHQPPPYYPMLFQPPSGFEAIRRQFGGGFGSDLVMVGLISLPIIGLLTMGSASLGNLLGLGLSNSSSKKSSSKRTKRSLKEKAADAVEYAKNLWNVMEQLERAFEKYDLYQAECRLRVVCEAHHKDRRMGTWGQSILDLMKQQKELEGRELLPVSRFLFSNYAEAAQAGARNENCAQLYTGCPRHLSYYLSAKEDQMENEVENGM